MFEKILGIPCPFCGLRASVYAFITGNIRQAFILNPVGPLIFLVLVGYLIYFTFVNKLNIEVQFNKEVLVVDKINKVLFLLLAILWIYKIGGI